MKHETKTSPTPAAPTNGAKHPAKTTSEETPAAVAAPAPAAIAAAATTPSTAAAPNILTMLIAQAQQNVAQATAAVGQAQAALPGLISLPEAQRKVVGGRLRDGEAQALLSVLATCALRPELVASLADEDNGVDPSTFETDLLSSRLQLAMLLSPLSAELAQLASNLDDTILYLNELTREPSLEAYAILKAVAKTDLAVKTSMAPALDFYSSVGRAAAATRKRNAAAKLVAQGATPAPSVVSAVPIASPVMASASGATTAAGVAK